MKAWPQCSYMNNSTGAPAAFILSTTAVIDCRTEQHKHPRPPNTHQHTAVTCCIGWDGQNDWQAARGNAEPDVVSWLTICATEALARHAAFRNAWLTLQPLHSYKLVMTAAVNHKLDIAPGTGTGPAQCVCVRPTSTHIWITEALHCVQLAKVCLHRHLDGSRLQHGTATTQHCIGRCL